MEQNRAMALAEATVDTGVGWPVALTTLSVTFPVLSMRAAVPLDPGRGRSLTAVPLPRKQGAWTLPGCPGVGRGLAGAYPHMDQLGTNRGPLFLAASGNKVFPVASWTRYPTWVSFGRGVAAWGYAAYSVESFCRGGSTPARVPWCVTGVARQREAA